MVVIFRLDFQFTNKLFSYNYAYSKLHCNWLLEGMPLKIKNEVFSIFWKNVLFDKFNKLLSQ